MESLERYFQRYINRVFKTLGAKESSVKLSIIKDSSPIAKASGAKVMDTTYGFITISTKIIDLLDFDEIKFVLAHEATHIYMNHLPIRLFSDLIRGSVYSLAYRYPPAVIAIFASEALKYLQYTAGSSPAEAGLTKSQEIQADLWGIIITGNKSKSVSALLKLANNDLDRPSHLWEVLGVKLPVMTVRERIRLIEERIRVLEKEGFKFE
jgi:Zn-dependent protease with chaperone function